MIQYIVYALVMSVLGGVINHLYTRDDKATDSGQDDDNYAVRVPKALKQVGLAMFAMGMLLFVMFFVFRISGNTSATVGHLNFFLIFALIGLLIVLWSGAWRIKVNGESLEVRRFLRKTQRLTFSEISRVKMTKKFQLVLYKGWKRVAIVDLLTDNRSRLEASLGKHGIQIEGQVE
ncbi:MAG: hypothetical protein LUH56_07190 [Oscillospiraceae bacterium]|nr:hypothetical protein [Oscillospiraceae bacterium]